MEAFKVNGRGLLGVAAIAIGLALGARGMAQAPAEAPAAPDAATTKKAADASAKRDADYAAAKEKCNAFTGEVKANCLGNANARFRKEPYERARPTIWNGLPSGMSLSRRSNSFFTTA